MSNAPFPLWTRAAADAAFTDPACVAARADSFERQIARRNRIERLAGIIQLPVWAGLGGFFLWVGEWPIGLTLLAIGAGVVAMLRNLSRRASPLERRPEEPCMVHLERQYARQLQALRAVPQWYIGPVIPGVLAFFGAVTAGVAETQGWHAALQGAAVPFGAAMGIFGVVIALNLIAARRLVRDLARLKALAARD